MLAFKGTFKEGDHGLDVAAVKRALRALGHENVKLSRWFGPEARKALRAFQGHHGLHADGVYGPATHLKLEPYFDTYGRWLYGRAKLRAHSLQIPPLPRIFVRPRGVNIPGSGRWGLQPWIVPQVEAIYKAFDVSVSAGFGGHPPHATDSDHRWGGAVDLIGSLDAMRACNLWGDGLRGHTFRWVGGPAHDADGVEPGHFNHTHLSWYWYKATTIFGTSRFKG